MATHNSTTARPGGDPPVTPTLQRRAFVAGAATLLPAAAASTLTTCAPSPIAAAVLPAHLGGQPDAELLRIAAELRVAEATYEAAARRQDDPGDTNAAADLDAASDALHRLLARMAATPAAGLAGVAAKAGRLTWSLGASGGHSIMDAEAPLAESLACDLARLVPGAVEPGAATSRQSPDAALVRIADAIVGDDAEAQRLDEPYFDVVSPTIPPEVRERRHELSERWHELRFELAEMRATTPEGHRAKARVLMCQYAPGGKDDIPSAYGDEYLAWSLCRDLLREGDAA